MFSMTDKTFVAKKDCGALAAIANGGVRFSILIDIRFRKRG